MFIIPTLTSAAGILTSDQDQTWAVVIPAVWLQISLNMSILAACIPSLRALIESILVPTTAAAVETPYQLGRVGHGTGIESMALEMSTFPYSGAQGITSTRITSSFGGGNKSRRAGCQQPEQAESVRKLTAPATGRSAASFNTMSSSVESIN